MFARGGTTTAIHRSNTILEHIVRPHAGTIGVAFTLIQENAHAHTARVSMTFLDDEGRPTSVMNRPAMSPDLNKMEHTSGILSRHIRQRPHHT